MHCSRARLLVFLEDFSAILLASSGGRLSPSFLHVCCKTTHNCKTNSYFTSEQERIITSSIVGAGTRIPKHRLFIAGMTLLVDCDVYSFGVVQRKNGGNDGQKDINSVLRVRQLPHRDRDVVKETIAVRHVRVRHETYYGFSNNALNMYETLAEIETVCVCVKGERCVLCV